MNIYNAIMLAADHIERNPNEFVYECCDIPRGPGCGTPGCAIGWIAHFVGLKDSDLPGYMDVRSRAAVGVPFWSSNGPESFQVKMGDLGGFWTWTAEACARNLRLYAEKYHANKKLRTDSELVAAIIAKIKAPVSEAVSEELTWA